ncbi:MAG: tetratricopeptide repeat protein [Clostridiales bacterium]|nr:tetratricopeptide repeat protein [Clostridiales bacterium]
MESNYIEDFLVKELLGADALKFNAGMKQILSYSLLERIGNKIQICEETQHLIRAAMSKKALNEVKLKIGELLSKIFSEILNSSYCILSCSRRSKLPSLIMHSKRLLTVSGREKILSKQTTAVLYVTMGIYHYILDSFKEAEELFDSASDIFSNDNKNIYCIYSALYTAYIYEFKGNYEESLKRLNKVGKHIKRVYDKNPKNSGYIIMFLTYKVLEAFLHNDFIKIRQAKRAVKETMINSPKQISR